jgi:hypothetical protein
MYKGGTAACGEQRHHSRRTHGGENHRRPTGTKVNQTLYPYRYLLILEPRNGSLLFYYDGRETILKNSMFLQGCGSSGLDPDSVTLWIRIRIGNPDAGSVSRGKKIKKF